MKDFFVRHREKLVNKLNGGLVVVTAYTSLQRTNDNSFYFEQEANFWWLTGIEAPDWWLIADGTRHKSWLVAPTVSESQAIFNGALSAQQVQEISGVDKVISQDEAMSLLRDLAKRHSVVHTLGEQPYGKHFNFVLNPAPRRMHELLGRIFNSVQDCRKDLSVLRAIKEPEEITRIKKSINFAVEAFKNVKSQLSSLSYEYEVEAEFGYYFRRRGLKGYSYMPVVAGGKNACTVHYFDNSDKLKKHELLLLDISFIHKGYAADIARTYALGEPTKRQLAIHAAIQTAHQQIIRLLKPNLPIEQYQREVTKIMQETLLSLGLIASRNDEQKYRQYFPHSISHGLGVDVHDSLGAPRFFQPGMVLTVEPGVYIPEEGIGMRIEDDILITKTGRTNLSGDLSTDL